MMIGSKESQHFYDSSAPPPHTQFFTQLIPTNHILDGALKYPALPPDLHENTPHSPKTQLLRRELQILTSKS